MKTILNNHNKKEILKLIINSEGISRAQIARDTKLNRSTISYVINELLEENYVYETSDKVLTGGRASTLIKFNFDFEKILVIDLQKRKIKLLVTNFQGDEIHRLDIKVEDHKNIDTDNLTHEINNILNTHPEILECGISIHGMINDNTKQITSPFYHFTYIGILDFMQQFGLNITLENEANIFTNGLLIDKQTNDTNFLNIHIKDGIGMGYVIDKKIHRGLNGSAGEIGHSIAIYDGKKCGCGNTGCLEQYASERALLNIIKENIHLSDVNIKTTFSENKDFKKAYDLAIKLLSIKINDLILTLDVNTIFITSELYYQIESFKSDILSNLKSSHYGNINIKVISSSTSLITKGYSSILLKKKFNIN